MEVAVMESSNQNFFSSNEKYIINVSWLTMFFLSVVIILIYSFNVQ